MITTLYPYIIGVGIFAVIYTILHIMDKTQDIVDNENPDDYDGDDN